MSARTVVSALIVSALLTACGGSHRHAHHAPAPKPATTSTSASSTTTTSATSTTAPTGTTPVVATPPAQALVTAETENRLLVVDLPSGRAVRRIALPPDPEDIAADTRGGVVVVVSPAAHAVTLLRRETLRPVKVLGGFQSPHIAAVAPDGDHAYVTDDARGTLTAIDLFNRRVTSTIHLGAGAHHMSFDMMHQRAWVALGESARQFVILDTSDFAHPRAIGRFDPGFAVHDLAFTDDGTRVWISSSGGRDVAVFDSSNRRLLFRVPVGPPPGHVALAGRYAYLTSGYGGVIEQVDARTGGMLARAHSPYGSFELSADNRYVVTSSLLRGTLAIYTPQLRLLRVVHLAPATREVALSSPA